MSMATAVSTNPVGSFLSLEELPATPPAVDSPRSASPETTIPTPQSRDSQYLTSSPVSSHVFLIGFYEQILKSKSIQRFPELRDTTQRALDLAKTEGFSRERAQLPHNIEVILQPMLTSCQTGSQTLTLIGLDGLSKLITYDYLSNQALFSSQKNEKKERSPIEKAVLAICGCFKGEITEDKVQTQIIKGLMAAVSSSSTIIHQEALLNAIRTLYNIFLLSRNLSNQTIAQGTLVQMSRSVFGRIKAPDAKKKPNLGRQSSASSRSIFSDALESSSQNMDDSDDDEKPQEDAVTDEKLSLEALGGKAAEAAANAQAQGNICDSSSDLNVLDGFLLFRALCKLSIKPYQADSSVDVRSMSLRSKLLALYLILIIVTEFPEVFTTAKVFFLTAGSSNGPRQVREATFLSAVKPYFGLCLTRNLVTTLPKIYELALAIFESVFESMRSHLKREIEVYLKEIIIPILEAKPTGNQRQKHVLFTMFLAKLCSDPQMLVEIYLNYDCDRGSLNNNIFEHLTGALSKLVTSIQASDDASQVVWEDADAFQLSAKQLNRSDLLNLPTLTSDRFTSGYISRSFFSRTTFTDAILQYRAMECLTGILKSLVKWSNKGHAVADDTLAEMTDIAQQAIDGESPSNSANNLPPASDDPTQFEQSKIEKQALQKGTDLFNRKPRKGIDLLIKNGSIPSSQPQDVARFLLQSPELSKEMIGEFLGDADLKNVEIMHAFVDQLDFSGLEFVSALRHFLQTFRLPGEAQKIDRFMLKFAERYSDQNPDSFATAETAYVLAYSVIMLNTDLHNPQVKRRMTLQEFIKNNRGINEGGDLPEEFLAGIYQQIGSLEIKLKDEVAPQCSDAEPSQQMQSNAEKYLKRLLSRKAHLDEVGGMAIFYSASHFEHVRPMFELCWMASLAAISELLKSHENNRIVALCLDGFRSAVHIAGFFDLELARSAFVTAISNFCFLSNIHEMRQKNLEAIRTVLDIAIDEGNYLKHSWLDVLQIVNHLVRLQLVPNFTASTNGQDRSLVAHRDSARFSSLAMAESNSQSMLIAVDKVFAYSVRLTGPAIVEFIRALSQIATDELADLPSTFDRTKAKSSPKMFSIQKVVEVAYYNMNRIRLEWKDVWAVLGPVFCSLGCHTNDTVGSFLVDSLRQLASKFLDREELAHFQFQKELLNPFIHIVRNNPSIAIKDMVLQCLQYMVQTNAAHLKSGWMTTFQCLGAAAGDRDADLVTRAFEIAKSLGNDHFDKISADPENFKAFLSCLAQFAKNPLFPKTSLHAVQAFHVASNHMVDSDAPGNCSEDTYWVAIFQGLMEMVLEVKDLEVRTRAMDHLFAHLHRHGQTFSEPFWQHLLSQVLFPLFSAIGQPGAKDKVAGLSSYSDEAAVWVSTTLVHALRKFVCLFTEFFDKVFQFVDGLLDLLSVCLCQEDPTLCRVGADCLRILLEENIERMSEQDWQRIISIVIRLFKASSRISQAPEESTCLTIPTRTSPIISKLESSPPLPLVPSTPAHQLNLCLTMISLVEEVFLQNDKVFLRLDPDHIFLILDLVERAYLETQRINSSFDLTHAIERQSVSKLEKFASTALSLELNCLVCLIKVLLKMYLSPAPEFQPFAVSTQNRLIPLCKDAFEKFNALSEHPLIPGVKSIYKLWHQVVLRVGNFLCKATGSQFRAIFEPISSEAIKTLKHRHLSHDVQIMIFNIMERVDSIYIHSVSSVPSSPVSQPEAVLTAPSTELD